MLCMSPITTSFHVGWILKRLSGGESLDIYSPTQQRSQKEDKQRNLVGFIIIGYKNPSLWTRLYSEMVRPKDGLDFISCLNKTNDFLYNSALHFNGVTFPFTSSWRRRRGGRFLIRFRQSVESEGDQEIPDHDIVGRDKTMKTFFPPMENQQTFNAVISSWSACLL